MARIQTECTVPESRRQPRTTRDLTPAQHLLLQIMREHQFGRLENVRIEAGELVLDQHIKVIRVARLGGESSATSVPSTDDFELKRAVCDLLDELARLGDCVIVRLEFRRGLPCLLETVATAVPGDLPSASEEPSGRQEP